MKMWLSDLEFLIFSWSQNNEGVWRLAGDDIQKMFCIKWVIWFYFEVEFSMYVFRGRKNSIIGFCINLRIKMNATQPFLVASLSQK